VLVNEELTMVKLFNFTSRKIASSQRKEKDRFVFGCFFYIHFFFFVCSVHFIHSFLSFKKTNKHRAFNAFIAPELYTAKVPNWNEQTDMFSFGMCKSKTKRKKERETKEKK